jgi:hypothetical protein
LDRDTTLNSPRIDAVWLVGSESNLCEVSRCRSWTDDRKESLLDILGSLDDHYPGHDIVVHGIEPVRLDEVMLREGYRITKATRDGFEAAPIPEVRDRLIGRA